MFHFKNLEELSLASNLFSSVPQQGSPDVIFKTIGGIQRLKRLNISRNKFFKFHSGMLDKFNDFNQLQELDISFNMIDNERNLMFLALTKAINVVNITGNPFTLSSKGSANYANLEYELQKNLSAVIINDTHLLDERGHLRKNK